MNIRINNRFPFYETVGLSLVVFACFGGAVFYGMGIGGVNHLTSAIVAISTGVIIVLLALFKRSRSRGRLVINTANKTFSLNGASPQEYSKLTRYESVLRTSAGRTGLSNMYIRIGDGRSGGFDIVDIDRLYFKPKGRTKEELIALEELIAGSSLDESKKASFEIWLSRAQLVHD